MESLKNEKMANKIELLANMISQFTEKRIKGILWLLCYDPDDFFEDFEEIEDYDKEYAENLQKAILDKCHKNEEFKFGFEKSQLDTYGFEFKISNPIIRDTVIEHCLKISENKGALRECISNICTKIGTFEYEERRSMAFEALDFSEEEQYFLEKSIDTYCIGEFLKVVQQKKYPRIPNVVLAEGEKPKFEVSNHKLSSNKLLENEELVRSFIIFFTKLEEVGIDPAKIAAKKKEVENFYSLAAGVCGCGCLR